MKNVLKKAHEQNQDLSLALLEYRNLSITGLKYSSAQILMSRRLRTKIDTCCNVAMSPKVVDADAD